MKEGTKAGKLSTMKRGDINPKIYSQHIYLAHKGTNK